MAGTPELTMDDMWRLVHKLQADVVTAYRVQGEMRVLLERVIERVPDGSLLALGQRMMETETAIRAWLAAHPAE